MTPVTRTGALRRAQLALAIALAIVLSFLGLVLPQVSQARAASGAPAATTATTAQMIQRVIDDTNAIRSQQGLPGLARDSRLDRVAQAWAEQQWKNGAMSHNPDYSTQIPPGWQRAGENVAKGYSYTQVVQAWKNSSSHYANMVHDYTSVGLGYFEQDGKRYWSMVFAKYPGTAQPTAPSASPAPAPTASSPAPTTPPPAPPSGSTASPAAEPAAPAGTPVPLGSPSFENGLGPWTAPAATVDGPNSSAKGGTRSLLVPGASGRTVTQTVATSVPAGATYTLTAWVRADASATGSIRIRALGGATETATAGFTASSSGWLKVTVALTVKQAHTSIAVDILTTRSGRTYRLDAVSLVRTGEPPAPAQPAPATGGGTTPSNGSTPANGSTGSAPSPNPTPPAPATPAPSPTPTPTPSSGGGIDLGIIRIGGNR